MTHLILWVGLWFSPTPVHSNVVGQIHVDNFGDELFFVATMDKRPLTIALMNEGDCSPKDMLNVCGDEYFQSHIQFFLNGEKLVLQLQRMDMEKEHVIFNYYVPAVASMEKIQVKSDYMLAYHDQSEVKVLFTIDQLSKKYTLSQARTELNLNLSGK